MSINRVNVWVPCGQIINMSSINLSHVLGFNVDLFNKFDSK